MGTASQLVDLVLQLIGEPHLKVNAIEYVNQTIREMHTHPDDDQRILLFPDNLSEVAVVADLESGYYYTIPNPQRLQVVGVVYYNAYGCYAEEKSPLSAYRLGTTHYYYRSGKTLQFNAYGGIGATITLASYYHPRRLIYYPAGTNPCTWSNETESYTYLDAYNGSDALKAEAEELSTNWIIERWFEVVRLGVEAKLWARVNKDASQVRAYSQYMSGRKSMLSAEKHEVATRYAN